MTLTQGDLDDLWNQLTLDKRRCIWMYASLCRTRASCQGPIQSTVKTGIGQPSTPSYNVGRGQDRLGIPNRDRIIALQATVRFVAVDSLRRQL